MRAGTLRGRRYRPRMLELSEIRRALVVVAHPDDIDFGVAGTVAVLTELGAAVIYCLVTSGEAGGDDRLMARHEMAEVREREQTQAAKTVGVTDLVFLRLADGRLEPDLELRKAIARVVRRVRPQVVVTQNPERNLDRVYASHPDHRAVGAATLDAVYPDARNPFAFPELLANERLEPHAAQEVWVMAHPEPNRLVDISSVIDRKIDALMCHESQVGPRADMERLLRDWARSIAQVHGLEGGEYAEGFRVVDTR
jgi:LmbE family N-acetylglucosaminyl deacetylase